MKNIESFYPLSPMQQGMLFHSLSQPGSGVYVELASVRLRGDLNIDAFEQTWQSAAVRHPILRTSFIWENVKEPIQIVHNQIKIPFQYLDWQDLSSTEQELRTHQYLKDEHKRGFDLAKPPLMRLALIKMQDGEYNFVWTYHHILLDGWSVPLLLQEVLATYTALNRGWNIDLPTARSFRDYILWLKRQNLAESEDYWRRYLDGFRAPTPLVVNGLDKTNLSIEPEFSEIEMNLSTTLTSRLLSFSRQQQVTMNTSIQAAWAILLSRYSREEEVVFGATVSGRPPDLSGSDQMLGLFINTLPVRVSVQANQRLAPWLKELQSQQAEMRQYEYTPLVHIQKWSQVLSAPLFESILVFENFPISGLDGGGKGNLNIEAGVFASYTNFPLTVVATPDENFSLKISYNRQLFDSATIERMLGHLLMILTSMIADPEQQLGNINLLTEAERSLLTQGWNQRQASYPVRNCIHQLVEGQVKTNPEAIAVVYQQDSITYSKLNQRANILAYYLRQNGVGPEVLVGVFLERGIDLIIATLGILKAGGAYVPLDPVSPKERLAFLIEDFSRAQEFSIENHNFSAVDNILNSTNHNPLVITEQALMENLPIDRLKVIIIDTEWEDICQQIFPSGGEMDDLENPVNSVEPENLAYVIYTSGSTGKPKGVMISHANVVRLFEATYNWFRFDASDVWTLFHSYAFDFSVWEIWGALFFGGKLVVVPYLTSRSPDLFYQMLIQEKVTVLNQTPSAFRQLMRAEEILGVSADMNLRLVIFGGESLEIQSLRPWFERHGDLEPQLVNMYGITETTVHVTYRPLQLVDLANTPGSVIGTAIPDLEVYILDQNQQPVPVGVPGELYVGGAGVGRGYLNRPELTSQRFLSGLFGRPAQDCVYRSGDLARYLPDGDIEYLGRIDHQVKIRGFRIELGEIESVLVQYKGISEAVVLTKGEQEEKKLVAFLIPEADSSVVELEDLRSYLTTRLPQYMIPSSFTILQSLPLTKNGKIDRRILDELDLENEPGFGRDGQVATARIYREPETDYAIKLARVWMQLLGVERVGLDDNFFSLGGDSISSIQLISRAKQAGINLSYRQIFEHPTLSELAAAVEAEATLLSGLNILPPILVEENAFATDGFAPLTPIQRWFFEHHQKAPEKFNTSMMMEVNLPLDPDLLRQTLNILIHHHAALRLRFEKSDIGWTQTTVESKDLQLPFYYYDLTQNVNNCYQGFIQEKAQELQMSFDLSSPPLLRMVYFYFGSNQPGRLLLIFHHLVIDGVSIRMFVEDFLAAYLQLFNNKNVELPPTTTPFLDWARRLHRYAQSEAIGNELIEWVNLMTPVLENADKYNCLPVDYPEGNNTYGLVEQETVFLSEEDTDLLLKHGAIEDPVSLKVILLTALVRVFAKLTGYRALFVETEGHGREIVPGTVLANADLSRTIGWFTSLYPILLDLRGASTVRDEIKAIDHQLNRVPDRGIGFGVIKYMRDDGLAREQINKIPQPQINFNYLGQFDQSGTNIKSFLSNDELSGQLIPPLEIVNEDVGFEQDPASDRTNLINIVVTISGGQVGVRWLYSRAIFKREKITQLAESYLHEVRNLIAELKN